MLHLHVILRRNMGASQFVVEAPLANSLHERGHVRMDKMPQKMKVFLRKLASGSFQLLVAGQETNAESSPGYMFIYMSLSEGCADHVHNPLPHW